MTLLLDTAVLMYAVGNSAHPLAAPAQRLLERASRESGTATTTPEVLQEFLHVRARRYGRGQARDDVQAFADLLTPLVIVTEQHVRDASELYVAHERIGAFDAVLAAVAISHDDIELVSSDSAFADIDVLPFRDLASF